MIAGTSVQVETVLRHLSEGLSSAEIAAACGLTQAQVLATLRTCQNCTIKCEILERLGSTQPLA